MSGIDFPLYLNITLYSILGLGAFFGFLKGFKKSLFSFITTIIFFVVFFLTVNLAVTYLWSLNVPQLSQLFAMISPELSTATSFSEAAPLALEYFLGEKYASIIANPNFLELAQGIGMFALKLVYTLLYFTLFFIIYKLICLIIRSIFFGGHKSNDKYVSKNRGLGLVFGLLEGAIGLYVTLIIFGGIMSISDSLVTLAPTDSTEEVELEFPRQHLYNASYTLLADPIIPEIPSEISTLVEELKGITEAYNSNLLVTFSNQLTMTDDNDNFIPLNIYLFDEVLSFEYNENQVSIRKELSTFASIGAYVLDMEYMETQKLNDITGDNIRDIFELLSDSDLIVSIIPLGIEIGALYLDTELTVPSEELYSINWEDELIQLGGIAATAFDIISLSGYFENDPNLDEVQFDSEMVVSLFDSLGESQLITLAAYVAVEPLLRSAGETVQAVLTLPSGVSWVDINWKDEFTGLGAILGEVLDSGITYSQIISGDYKIILNAVANVDFTILLQSNLVCYSLINILSGAAGIEGLDMIVIPEGIQWLIYDEDGKTIIGGELKNILSAISAMTSIIGKIDFDNLSPAILSDLSDESIDTIFESRVLVASLSSVLLGFDLGEFQLIVPSTAVDEDYYIIKDEMKSMLKAVKLLMKLPECDETTEDCSNLEPDYLANALSLTKDEIDIVISSDILKATVGNLLNEMNQDPLVIPSTVLENIEIAFPELRRGETLAVISGDEIKKVIQAVMVFEITNFEDVVFDASIIQKLDSETNPGEVDEDKLTTVFESGVIHATISKVILDLTTGEDAFVSVPYYQEDNLTSLRYTQEEIEYISIIELKAALRALHSLNITDFNNIEAALDINTILDKVDLLLDSSILQATISQKLLEMNETVVVPETYFNDVAIQISVGDADLGTDTIYIFSEELENIFDALQVLKIEDLESINMDASIINNLEDTEDDDADLITEELSQVKLNTLFASAIIHATLSDVLLDLTNEEDNYVVVPNFGLDDNNDEYEVLFSYDSINYIVKSELINALEALYSLNITDFDTIESTLNLSVILDNIDVLLDSAILHATVSKQLLDMNTDNQVVIPAVSMQNDPVQIQTGDVLLLTDNLYITRDELRSIFSALEVLNIDDISSVTFDATIINNLEDTEDDDEDTITSELSQNKLDTLFASVIIHATISDMLIDLENAEDPYVVVPSFGLDDNQNEIAITETAYGIDYIYIFELENVLRALYALDVENFDNMEETLTLEKIIQNVDVLLESSILHATVSKTLLDLESDQIVIPYVDWNEDPIVIETGDVLQLTNNTYVIRDELKNVFDALDVLGISSPSSFDGSVDLSVLEVEGNRDILLSSYIIQATVSDQIIGQEAGGSLVVPYVRDNNITTLRKTVGPLEHQNEFILLDELESILDALVILEIYDVTTFDGTVDLAIIAEGDNSTKILTSSVIQATVTKQIIDLNTNGTITVPKYMEDNTTLIINSVGSIGFETDYISTTELEALFDALHILGFDDVNGFEGTVNLSVLAADDNASVVLSSTIVQATVSKQVLDVSIDGSITVPYFDESELIMIRILTGSGLDAFTYINADELENMIFALNILEINDVSTYDGAVDLTDFYDEANRNTLLSSSIMQATISKQLFDRGSETLTIPYYSEDDLTTIRIMTGVIGYQTEYVTKSEIHAMFEALELLNITDITTFSGTISLVNFFEQPGQDKNLNRTTLLASASMHATISKQLLDLNSDSTLVVPDQSQDGTEIRVFSGEIGFETEFVTKLEIIAMFDALETLGITDINNFNGTVNLNKVYGDINQTIILSSASMHATITKQIDDLEADVLVVPVYDVFGNTISSTVAGTFFLNKDEIKGIINAMEILGIDNIVTFEGDISLSSLFPSATTEYNENQNILLSSSSMHATISKQINDLGPEVLVVPDTDINDNLIKDSDYGTLYIYKDEIKAIINALDFLNVTDITSFLGEVSLNAFLKSTTPDEYEQNQNTLLASASMHATITKQIDDLGSDILLVPTNDIDNILVKTTVSGTLFIIKDEIKALINALDLLNVTDITTFTGSVSLNQFFESTNPDYLNNQNTLLLSASMHATVSKQMLDLGSTKLVVPNDDINSAEIRSMVLTTEFIVKDEIKALINALDILGVNDITSFTGTVTLNQFFASTNPAYDSYQDTLLLSASMHATISKQMLDLGSEKLVVPTADYDNVTVKTIVSLTDFITKAEIKNLINALDVLGVNDIEQISGGFTLSNISTGEDQDVLLASASMHATISQKLFSQPDDVLIIPIYSQLGEIEANRIQKTVSLTDYVTKSEIKALINAFIEMEFINLESFGTSIDSSKFFNNPDVVLLSSSIQATFSNKMLTGTNGELIVPNTDIITAEIIRIVQSDVTYIEIDEMKAIIHALELLGLTNFATMDFTPAKIFSADFDQLLASVSMQATISVNILSGALDQTAPVGSGSLIVPDYFRQAITVGLASEEQIEKTELKKLLTALNTLGISDFGGSVNASIITTMTDANLTTMLLSGSMHVTMDNMLKGNPNILVPDKAYVGGNQTTPIYDINGVITANEIKYFILAASTVGGGDFTNVDFDYSLINGLSPENQTIVLTSMIVRNMITPDLVAAVNTYNAIPAMFGGPDPVQYSPIPNNFYEDEDNTTFLTSAGILTLIDYLPL